MADVPEELDVVRFTRRHRGVPEGTAGTLVEAFKRGGIVELPDDELVVAPYRKLAVTWSFAEHQAGRSPSIPTAP